MKQLIKRLLGIEKKEKQRQEKERRKQEHLDELIRGFVLFFDGLYIDGVDDFPPHENVSNTFRMGICGFELKDYGTIDKKLIVSVRRPGLLIGKGGWIIDKVQDSIGCRIDIKEIKW